jgi:RNA polymerase sigma-70 factor (ECF subfamily)
VPGSPSFVELVTRLRQGDDEAAAQVFELYARRLIDLARSQLSNQLRRKLDPEDVAQSALKSFFLGVHHGKISLSDWDGLWSLLVIITVRKCRKQVVYYRRARRAVAREVPALADDNERRLAAEALARDPSPDEAAQFIETLDEALCGFDAIDRQVLLQALRGDKPAEISETLGITQRRTYRVLERVRTRLARRRDAD